MAPFGGEVAGELEHAGFAGVVCRTDEALGEESVGLRKMGKDERFGVLGGYAGKEGTQLTLFATVPLMDAINAILPPFPHLIICFATACAAMKTPVMLTSNIVLASLAEYSNALVSC